MSKIGIIALLIGLNIFICNAFAFSQGTIAPVEEYPQLEWLWGEVVSVDVDNNKITVKYPDYETDQDKEITLLVNVKTRYSNISSLGELKPQDTLSIDYRVSVSGENIAENISLDKPDEEGGVGSSDVSAEEVQQETVLPE